MPTQQEIQQVKNRFGIIGNAPALNYAIQMAMQVADTDLTVLITGESGSGKESFSKIIHNESKRKHGQFIAVNCGAIPEGTIDSELFGHEKGAFTSAYDARKGYFEVTNGGTIFLDEIGEMPLETQARLLRVLENGEFIKVGSSKVQKTDVRVIAATHKNLLDAVDRGKFREDLYYRLSTVPIKVPALRERGQDIELLFRKFITDFAEKYRMSPITLTEDAKDLLIRYPWPGNIRQLKNIAEQVSVLELDRVIDANTLAKYLPETRENRLPAITRSVDISSSATVTDRDLLLGVLADMRRDMNDLKRWVLEVVKGEGKVITDKVSGLQDQMQAVSSSIFQVDATPDLHLHNSPVVVTKPVGATSSPNPVIAQKEPDYAYAPIEDIIHLNEEESLSLNEKEKEMILKALRKNNHRRKQAAQDLGISERTLYRKIKEYEIDS